MIVFMNCTKNILAATMIVLYLLLPVQIFAHVTNFDTKITGLKISKGMVVKSHCNDCPCSHEQDSDCCDTASCNCSYQAPLVQHSWFTYSPVVKILLNPEPHWSLPQVYLPIFVPPQSFAWPSLILKSRSCANLFDTQSLTAVDYCPAYPWMHIEAGIL